MCIFCEETMQHFSYIYLKDIAMGVKADGEKTKLDVNLIMKFLIDEKLSVIDKIRLIIIYVLQYGGQLN